MRDIDFWVKGTMRVDGSWLGRSEGEVGECVLEQLGGMHREPEVLG